MAFWTGVAQRLFGTTQTKNTLQELYSHIDPESIDKWLGYLNIYEKWFNPYQDTALRILEIGIQGGGSLKLWRDYFGQHCEVVGIDIDNRCASNQEAQIKVHIGDQADSRFLSDIVNRYGYFDIVVDDGSHIGAHQIMSYSILYPITKLFYCVEDTHTAYWDRFKIEPNREDFVTFAKRRIDDLHHYFIVANSGEQFSEAEWIEAIHGERNYFRDRTLGVHFYDSLVLFEVGLNPLPSRRQRSISVGE